MTNRTNIDFCGYCGLPASRKCEKCLTRLYCSKTHQRKDWPTHASLCETISNIRLNVTPEKFEKLGLEAREIASTPNRSAKTDFIASGIKFKGDQVEVFDCWFCGGPGPLKCGVCKIRRYCSKECQRWDWKSHRVECPTLNITDRTEVKRKTREEFNAGIIEKIKKRDAEEEKMNL